MSILHVASVSTGKDSVATLLLALERFGRERVIPIFCDTGNEDKAVYEYLDYLDSTLRIKILRLRADFSEQFSRKRAFIARDVRTRREYDTAPVFDSSGEPVPKRDGRGHIITRTVRRDGELVVEAVQKVRKVGGGRRVRWTNKTKRRALAALHPTGNPFLDLCMLKGRFPSRKAQFCTEELKRNPAVEFQMTLVDQGHTVVSWQGIRRDESHARRNAKKFESIGGGLYIYRPIVTWTAADTFAYAKARGIKPNPLYLQNFSRVGCMLCINASKAEIQNSVQRCPEHPARLADWEVIVSACSKRGFSTFFHKLDDLTGSPASIFSRSKMETVIEWSRTSRGGRQFSLLTDLDEATTCSSSYGLCE